MKNKQTRSGGNGAFPLSVGALCAGAFLCCPAPASAGMPQPPRQEAGARGASGPILQYVESRGGRIVYLEERGGILLPVADPVPGSRRDELPPPGAVRKDNPLTVRAPTPPAVASGLTARRALPVGSAANP